MRHLAIRYNLVRCYVTIGEITMRYCVTEDMVAGSFLADSGATHILLRESVLPSLAHLMRPAHLPPMPLTLPNGMLMFDGE